MSVQLIYADADWDYLVTLVKDGLTTDGAHHKQHYLELIAEALDIEAPDHEPGIAP